MSMQKDPETAQLIEELNTIKEKNKQLPGGRAEVACMEQVYNVLNEVGYKQLERIAHEEEQSQVPKSTHYFIARAIQRFTYVVKIGDDADSSRLYIYNVDTGVYDDSLTLLNRLILAYDFRSNMQTRREVHEFLKATAPFKKAMGDKNRIPVKNGIYDLKAKKLLPFSPNYTITSKIETAYNPEATSPAVVFGDDLFDVDEWFMSIADDDEETYNLLWEVINEAINPNYTRGRTAFLYGGGNNGKGTYQQLLINLVGMDKVASLQPADFGDRFTPFALMNKVINIGDDAPSTRLKAPNMLKSISTGDPVLINEKYGASFTARLKLFCLFSCNDLPTANDSTDGWYRRLLLIPFNADFNGKKENRDIKEKYIADRRVLEYVLKKALELDFERFTEPEKVAEALHGYKKKNDYIEQMLHDVYLPNNLQDEERVPHDFIRQAINDLQHEHGASERLPYGYVQKFVDRLEDATGNTYRVNIAQRYPEHCQNDAHPLLRRYYHDHPQVIKSIVRK